jgi:hypothetical protein
MSILEAKNDMFCIAFARKCAIIRAKGFRRTARTSSGGRGALPGMALAHRRVLSLPRDVDQQAFSAPDFRIS